MPPFRRADSPYWWISYSIQGRRIRESSGTKSKKLAVSLETKKRHEANQIEKHGKEPVRTFDELLLLYLQNASPKSLETARYAGKRLYEFFHGANLNALSRSDITQYIGQRMVKPATVRRELEVLRAAINHAQKRHGWNIPNPVYLPAKPKPRLRWLTKEEYHKLLEATDQEHIRNFIILGVNTGMRHREMLNLTWDRVDPENGMVYFQPDQAKSGRFQSIPLNNTAKALLESMRGHISHVFTYRGQPIGSVKKGFIRAVSRAGLSDVTPHTLRHTFASWLVQKGVPIKTVQELMRHSDINATMIYAHLSPDNTKEAVGALEDI